MTFPPSGDSMPVLPVHLGPAPAALWFEDHPERAAARGTVLLYHGFSARKETGEKELASLARAGFLAVGVDCVGHGERRYEDFEARFAGSGDAFLAPMLEAVRETVAEVPAVLDALAPWGTGPIGVAGISMGALVAYGAVLQERRFTAGACLLGTPRYRLGPDSPHLHLDRFFPLALLSQCAGADASVPPADARAFHAALAPHYRAAPHRQQYVEFPGEGHFLSAGAWDVMWGGVLAWFGRYLAT